MAALLFKWRWALSSQYGPKRATDRHVALTLALYMRPSGEGAFPSQAVLAMRTGLSTRSVRDALHRLVSEHWLRRSRHPRRGRAATGRGFNYSLRLPQSLSKMLTNGEAASLFNGRDAKRYRKARIARRGNGEAGSPGKMTTPKCGSPRHTNTVHEHNKSVAVKEEYPPAAVDAGLSEEQGKNQSAAEQKLQRLERRYLDGELSESDFCSAVSLVQQQEAAESLERLAA